jgi:hypothetical protein
VSQEPKQLRSSQLLHAFLEFTVLICWAGPYGIDERIVHLVVWTKFDLEDDPETDDLTEQARKEIDDYVEKTFCKKVGKENVSVT